MSDKARRVTDATTLHTSTPSAGDHPFGPSPLIARPSPHCIQTIRHLTGHLARFAIILFCLATSSLLITTEFSRLPSLDEAGDGDSYILYDTLNYLKTGVIYRDLSQPPYLPAQYSPLLYMLYSVPGRVVTLENPFVGPRLLALSTFFLCILIAVSIVRTLVPIQFAWIWGVLLAASIGSMRDWVLQLRGDFPAIVCE